MTKTELFFWDGYMRRSTDEGRQLYTLDVQEDKIREWIDKRKSTGHRLFRIHSDEKSGATLDRPGLESVLEDAREGLIRGVLIVKLDRLCRNLQDQLFLTRLFEKENIRLQATDEDINLETLDGVTWAQIRGVLNDAERRTIAWRTQVGMRKKASLGFWCGGYVPLGYRYDRDEKILIPDPEERHIVEKVFDLYVERRMGAKSIALYLNQQGLRTRRETPFSTASVLTIITNPLYGGKIRWGGEVYPGKHEPLVGEDTLERAQAILSGRRGDPSLRRSNSSRYILSGLLRCGRCGRALVGVSANGRGGHYEYYGCPGKFKSGECELENLPRERIDRVILTQLKDILGDREVMGKILQRVNLKRMEKLPKKRAELKMIEKSIAHQQTILRRYLTCFESGMLEARALSERVHEIENEIALLEDRKEHLEEEITQTRIQPVTAEDLAKVMRELEEVILSAGPPQRKAFLRNVVKTIKVQSPHHIEPCYRIPSVRIMSGMAPRSSRCYNSSEECCG